MSPASVSDRMLCDKSARDTTDSDKTLCDTAESDKTLCDKSAGEPIFASTPLVHKPLTNGHHRDVVDNRPAIDNNNDTLNGNVSGESNKYL